MTDEGAEENASTLIKNVDRLFVLAMINWSWSAISEQEVVCCYIGKFKGYILVYPLTCIYIQRKMFFTYLICVQKETFFSPNTNECLVYCVLMWIWLVTGHNQSVLDSVTALYT